LVKVNTGRSMMLSGAVVEDVRRAFALAPGRVKLTGYCAIS
jgi:hypothetical protein